MAYSYYEYAADGSTQTFAVPFAYVSQDEVEIFVDGVQTTAFSFTSGNTITLDTAPSVGATVRVGRTTNLTQRAVDFTTGAVLTENDLDTALIQVFHAAQEAIDTAGEAISKDTDGEMDAQNRIIKNVADPEKAQDAVTKNYLENTWLTLSDKAQLNALDIPSLNRVYQSIDELDRVYTSVDELDRVYTSIGNVDRVDQSITNVDRVATSADNLDRVYTSVANVDRVATSADNLDRVHTSIGNVDRVDQSIDNVDRVATSADNLDRVHTSIAKVDRVYTSISNIDDVAADLNDVAGSSIDTVAGSITNVNNVGNNIANVNAVAGNESNINAAVANESNINAAVANESNINAAVTNSTNINTVAGISADVTAVAGIATDIQAVQDQLASVQTVASDLLEDVSEIEVVAADLVNVDAVGTNITSVNTVAANIADVNNFADTYSIGATAPTTPTTGDLWFDTSSNTMKVYDGSGFVNAGSSVNGVANSVEHVATAGQTTFNATYDSGYVDVYMNGVLLATTDYTATDGSTVVLDTAATAGDVIFIQSFGTFTLADVYNKTQSDARYMPIDEVTLPDQTGHSGQYLTTDGTTADWADVPPAVTSDIHCFTFDLDGNVYWTHGADVTALQDGDQNDLYDLVIVGSSDQTYSVNQTTGQFEVTIS